MKIKYPLLMSLLALVALVAFLCSFNIVSGVEALALVGAGQMAIMALAPAVPGRLFIAGLTSAQVREFEELMVELKDNFSDLKDIPAQVSRLVKDNDELRREVNKLRKTGLSGSHQSGVRWLGNVPFVSDDCAGALTSLFVVDCANTKGALEMLIPESSTRRAILAKANSILGIEMRAGGALTGTDIPLPTIYMPQIVELVFMFGQARQFATVFPLGSGQVKLPRLKAGEDNFSYLGTGTAGGMSQAVPQKEVTAELVSFDANKCGGMIRIPYELEEDTFIAVGQFLARYIARQFAKLEDSTLFLADGTATYAGQTGVATYCAAVVAGKTPYLATLAATKTKPSDATLSDFRNMRALVNPAILGNMIANMGSGAKTQAAYYLHPTFEPFLRSFNQYPNFIVFEYVNGQPMFDGWPVRWIGVSQPYGVTAAPGAPIAFFGDLSYWYLGERGTPRVEVSREVFFATDELAMRALERIHVQNLAVDAMATLQTAAA